MSRKPFEDFCLRKILLLCTLTVCCWVIPASGIRCYVCENARSHEECNQAKNLKECPRDVSPSQDVCEIKTHYDQNKGYSITKSCGTGPCSVGAANSEVLSWVSKCEKDKPQWTCESCCPTDGCNTSGASSIGPVAGFGKRIISLLLLPGLALLLVGMMATDYYTM